MKIPLFQKTLNLTPTDMNQFFKVEYIENNFQLSIFYRKIKTGFQKKMKKFFEKKFEIFSNNFSEKLPNRFYEWQKYLILQNVSKLFIRK